MALKELEGSRHERYTTRGITATREWVCTWAEREDVSPRIGDVYPFITDPPLYLQELEAIPWGHASGTGRYDAYTHCKVIGQYTTREPKLPELSLDMSVEYLEAA
jgi:hypothetical protein